MRKRREMNLRNRIVKEEWTILPDVAFHERDPSFGGFPIHGTARIQIEHLHFTRALARFAFPDVGRFGCSRIESGRARGLSFVAGHGDAVPFIETLVGRSAPVLPVESTDMPFAEQRGGITQRLECLCDGDLPLCDARILHCARAHRITTRQQRCARYRAGEFYVEVVETHTFRSHPVDARRGYTAHT